MNKYVEGYEGLYTISENGDITNCLTNRVLHGSVNSFGYRVVSLSKDGRKKDYKLHQILAKAFLPNPNNYRCINHKDGNKLNNTLDNLEWCTHSMNNFHARTTLRLDFSRKPVVQSTLDGKLIAVWSSSSIAATFLKGDATLIQACCKGTSDTAYDCRWKYLDRLLSNF